MTSESQVLNSLSSDECYALLSDGHVGRLGVMIDGYPVIIPVNYAMDGFVIVFHSRPGNKLDHLQYANVTFQADHVDDVARTGWSVLVRGQAEVVGSHHSETIVNATAEAPVQAWVPGTEGHSVRVIPHGISGRRITSTDEKGWHLGTAAYM